MRGTPAVSDWLPWLDGQRLKKGHGSRTQDPADSIVPILLIFYIPEENVTGPEPARIVRG